MGKRSSQFEEFEEDERFARCHVCHEDIVIDYYLERDDVIYCEECDSEYVLTSRNPIRISLLNDNLDDYDDDFFDDYSGRGYD